MEHPALIASKLLAQYGGNQRKAEVEAWRQFDAVKERNPEGAGYWSSVAVAIVDGTEQPPVARTTEPSVGHDWRST